MPIPVFTKTTLFFVVCLLLTGYFVYTASSGTVRQRQQNEDHEAALAEIEDLRSRRDHLLAVYDYVVSDAYVEQAARRELGTSARARPHSSSSAPLPPPTRISLASGGSASSPSSARSILLAP